MNNERRRRSHLINYSKWRERLKTLKAEEDTEVVEQVILVVEVKDKRRRKNNPTNKVGAEEDDVHGEEVGWATQMLSALSVTSMVIMQRSATRISVSVVVRSYIKIFGLRMEEKRQSTS